MAAHLLIQEGMATGIHLPILEGDGHQHTYLGGDGHPPSHLEANPWKLKDKYFNKNWKISSALKWKGN